MLFGSKYSRIVRFQHVIVIAETRRLLEEEVEAVMQGKLWAEKPNELVSELSETCRSYMPDQIQIAKRAKEFLTPPAAACKLEIIPAYDVAADLAILAIQVCTRCVPCIVHLIVLIVSV